MNNKLMKLLSKLLYNLKKIGVIVTIIYGILFIESSTDAYGITYNEFYIMYTFWISFAITLVLFLFEKKGIIICDRILDYIDNKLIKR